MRKLFVFMFMLFLSFGKTEESVAQDLPATRLPVATSALTKSVDAWQKSEEAGFIENKGQIRDQNGQPNAAVKYLLNMNGLNVQLRANGFSYDTWVMDASGDHKKSMPAVSGMIESLTIQKRQLKFHRVDIELKNANPQAEIIAEQPLSGYTNMMMGPDMFSEIHSFKKVTYKNIYPGIDLEFIAKRGADKPVEYNFIVHPGADPSAIKMQYNGADKITLAKGEIEMKLAFGTLKEKIPASFIAQTGQSLNVQYKNADQAEGMYAFNVPAYDKTKTLVIDPTPSLVWATYLGGVEQTGVYDYDRPTSIKVDNQGNVVVIGTTSAANGIASGGVPNTTISTATYRNSYIAKYTAAGVKIWACYVGGNVEDVAGALAIDGSNNIYMAESTVSTNLSIAGGSGHNSYIGAWDIYVLKLSPAGAFQWGNYMGGSTNNDFPMAMEMLPNGNLVVGGNTVGGGAAIAFGTGYDQTFAAGGEDGYVLTMNGTTGAGIWGTYVGGPGDDYVFGLASDAAGNIYFSGNTSSTSGIATAGSYQPANGGSYDGFIGKLNSTGSTLSWCTYYGGTGADGAYDIQVDKSGNLVIGGIFASAGFSTPGSYQPGYIAGNPDGFIMKMSTGGNRIWATYYGGPGFDIVNGIQIDENNNIYISGYTASTSGIATNCSFQSVYGGGSYDCFIGKLDSTGSTRLWSSYFGGANIEQCNGAYGQGKPIAYTSNGVFYMAGYTFSTGLATGGAADMTLDGQEDAFIAKFTNGFAPSDLQVTAQTVSPASQTACALGIPGTITGNLVSIYNPATFTSPIFYQWQVADSLTGVWTDLPGEVYKDLTPLASNTTKYYRRKVLVNNGFCDKLMVSTSPVASVTISGGNAPIANANGPQWFLCGSPNTVTLNGSATGGSGTYASYQWYAGSNLTTPVASTAIYSPTNITTATTYTLKVTDNAGCSDLDQVTIAPVIANAGPDSVMCQGTGGIQLGTPGAAGGAVTYSWAIISGPAGSLSCTACAQPIATPTAATTYRLTVTVTRKDGTTCVTTDDVILSFVAAPTNGPLLAGADKTICKNSTTTLGNGTADPGATYTWVPGNYLSATNVATPTFNAGIAMVSCPLTYTVTATKGGCAFSDQINVSVINPEVDYQGQMVPCYVYSEQLNEPNCGGATYAWVIASGPGQQPTGSNLRDNGASAVLYNPGATNSVFYRTTTLNGVTCPSQNITLQPCTNGCPATQIKIVGDHGCPKAFPGKDLQLYLKGVNPADWDYSWTPASIMDNPNAPVVSISSTVATTVNLTITNKITGLVCTTAAISINDPSWILPTINTPDRYICPGTPSAIGEPVIGGYSYQWTPTLGLTNYTTSNPLATLNNTSGFHVIKTDNATGCTVEDDVQVNVQGIDYGAGNSRTICNGATVTLGTTPGGNYTYSWAPAGAAYTNGTTNTSANPQVLYAGSSQTFTVVVTDPQTQCTKTDSVTLLGSVTPGSYAGASGSALCPGATAQLGTAAAPTATYTWSPATGLSCTTCSNPVVTAGTTNQTYTINVSYPGCTVPVSDQVTISVKPVSPVVFSDQTFCPSAPTNIGVGGTGNSSSIANVSTYSWSPATALSCTNCASPNANPQSTTTYTATVTFTNGCVVTDDATITPTVTATAKPDATICPGGSVQLGSPSQAGTAYTWISVSGSPVGTLSCTNCAQPIATPTVTTVYRLSATKGGCTITDDVQITVKALPAINISGNPSICAGGTTSLSVTPLTQNMLYQWSPLTGVLSPNSATTIIAPTATTSYRLTQTDVNSGCSSYKDVVVAVSPNNISATGGTITVCPSTSATMPLTVTPSFSQTIVWNPATNLSSPYAQNPTVTPQTSGSYIATVTNTTTNCTDTALVTVVVPANCNGSDYGDAPASYDGNNPASHGITNTLKIGTAIDAEGGQISTLLANGDDLNQVTNDEEGISFLPGVNTASKTVGVVVNSVLNNTGKTAYMVSWIDFNRDGDFDDAGEQSVVLPIATSATPSNPILQFTSFNNGCAVKSGPSFLRVRLTTDTTGNWNNLPLSKGARADGEVEDYGVTIYGADFGDAPAIYPTAKALVNPDVNLDGKPDAAGSVWLGSVVDYRSCDIIPSTWADADDNDGLNDDDGLVTGGHLQPNATANWNITVNSQGPVNNVQWGMWIDWDADGSFDNFYNGNVNTNSPVVVPVSVTAAANAIPYYIVRVGVKTGNAFANADYNFPVSNGEWEDYIGAPNPLSITLLSFTATKMNQTALLQWQIASAESTDYFIVERSTDAKSFSEIGRVKANTKMINYSFVDHQPETGSDYYRLRMADKDGSYKLSGTRKLDFAESTTNTVALVPNPAHDQATILFGKELETKATVRILNNLGQIVHTYLLSEGQQSFKLDLGGNIPGVYMVTIDGDNISEHLKLVIQ